MWLVEEGSTGSPASPTCLSSLGGDPSRLLRGSAPAYKLFGGVGSKVGNPTTRRPLARSLICGEYFSRVKMRIALKYSSQQGQSFGVPSPPPSLHESQLARGPFTPPKQMGKQLSMSRLAWTAEPTAFLTGREALSPTAHYSQRKNSGTDRARRADGAGL